MMVCRIHTKRHSVSHQQFSFVQPNQVAYFSNLPSIWLFDSQIVFLHKFGDSRKHGKPALLLATICPLAKSNAQLVCLSVTSHCPEHFRAFKKHETAGDWRSQFTSYYFPLLIGALSQSCWLVLYFAFLRNSCFHTT